MQVLTPEERHQHQFSEVAILYHDLFIDIVIFSGTETVNRHVSW